MVRILVSLIALYFIFNTVAKASVMSEIDLVVRESIEFSLKADGKDYDESQTRLGEIRSIEGQEDLYTVESSVWAEQFLIHPNWGWHDCVTELHIKNRRVDDLGTSCYFSFD